MAKRSRIQSAPSTQHSKKVQGHALEQVSTTLRAPGAYALTLKTDQLQMVIIFDRAGLSIESLEVNLG